MGLLSRRFRVGKLEAQVDPPAAFFEVRAAVGREGPGAQDIDQVPRAILAIRVDGVDPLDVPRPVGGALARLWGPGRPPAADRRPVLPEEIQAGPLELAVEALPGVDRLHLHLPPGNEVAGIHSGVDIVEARAGRSALDDAPDVGV